MSSADGRGRTIWEILTKRNKKDLKPLELQFHNPLSCRCGSTISFEHEPEIAGVNFVVEKIGVYETRVYGKKFYHTDYFLKGMSFEQDSPVRLRLRLIHDKNVTDKLEHRVQLLHQYMEMGYDQNFHEVVLADPKGELLCHNDDEGNPLPEPKMYWRVENVFDPYEARVTILKDDDGNGTVDESELERSDVTYYDYSRITNDEAGQEFTEFLTIEMDKKSKYFFFLRGTEVHPSQIFVY